MRSLELKGQAVKYRLRPSKRAKRVIVRVLPDANVEVAYPAKLGRPANPGAILRDHADWILRAIAKCEESRRRRPPRTYESGEEFHYLGMPIRLEVERRDTDEEWRVGLEDNTLKLQTPSHASTEGRRDMIVDWYRRRAKSCLPIKTRQLADKHGFRYSKLRIKNQKTLWGSCSAKRNINLNLRLMMLPDAAIDAVILHELCHLRELNHGPAFWRLVKEVCPQHEHWDNWLKDNAHLMRF